MKREFSKNVPNWQPSKKDYLLIFRYVEGYWREISGNIPKFENMVLADYLAEIDIQLPDDCTFCRVSRDWWTWEYRANGGQIRVNFYETQH